MSKTAPGDFLYVTTLRRVMRSYAGHPLFVRFLYFALRNGLPLVRRIKPLFGSTALISLTYRCQCSCRHCGAGLFKKDGERELSTEEVFGLLRDLRAAGGSGAHFFGGEPLLAPDIVALVAEGSRLGLKITIETNGLLVDDALAGALARAGVESVRISLDSPDEASHDKFRGVPGAWQKAVSALRACHAAGTRTLINYYASRESLNSGEFDRMADLAVDLGAGLRVLPPVRAGLWKNREDIPLTKEETDLLRSRLRRGVACWGYEFLDRPGAPFRCHTLLHSTFDVSAYGDILPCPYLSRSFGNIRKEPLAAAVKRMWDADFFAPEAGFDGCPLNAPSFQARYSADINLGGPKSSVIGGFGK